MATMKKFKLSFSEDYNDYHETPTNTELRRFGEILGLERKFHTIEVKKGDIKAASEYCAKAIVRIIAQHGSQLRKLIFFRVSLNNRNEFCEADGERADARDTRLLALGLPAAHRGRRGTSLQRASAYEIFKKSQNSQLGCDSVQTVRRTACRRVRNLH